MSQTVGREFSGAGLPAHADRTAELAVPHPLVIAGQTRNYGTSRQRDRRTFRLAIDLLGEEPRRVLRDSLELLLRRLRPAVVR